MTLPENLSVKTVLEVGLWLAESIEGVPSTEDSVNEGFMQREGSIWQELEVDQGMSWQNVKPELWVGPN